MDSRSSRSRRTIWLGGIVTVVVAGPVPSALATTPCGGLEECRAIVEINATDGDIGHVEDLLVDEDGWMIRYLLVDTRNWLPGRKVLIAPSWVSGVDWLNEKVAMQVTREKIKGSPEYKPDKEIDRRFEHDLHTWYGHAPYW